MSGSILISSDSSEDVKPVISGDYDEKTVDDGSTIIDTCSSSESKGIIQISVATPTPTPTSPIVSKHSSNSVNNSNININNDVGVGVGVGGEDCAASSTSCTIASNSSGTKSTPKPLTVTVNGNDRSKDLNEHDVVCEKGRGDHERWPGNKLYRHLINVNKETYNELAPIERSNIIGKIISTIQEKDGWFVSHSEASGNWARLTEEKVRKKVSDDLRREVRRQREKRSHNSKFSAKVRYMKERDEVPSDGRDIIERVDDPRQADVLFGPGARRHPGNKTYWHHMQLNLDQYIVSPFGNRSMISRNIVQIIRSHHGRFLEQDPKSGLWYSISDKRAIEKTSHALSNMKYKTQKRHPDESPSHMYLVPHGGGGGGHPHHLAYRVGPYSEDNNNMMFRDGMDDGALLDGEDSPTAIYAKNRTKKSRLLNRMDDVVDDDRTPMKGNHVGGSDDDNIRDIICGPDKDVAITNNVDDNNSRSSNITTTGNKNNTHDPITTPVPGMMKEGKIISPGPECVEYLQEQRDPNGYHRRVDVPMAAGMTPADGSYGTYHGGADIIPRISQFEYMKHYSPTNAPGPNSAVSSFKSISYPEYESGSGAIHGQHHHHQQQHQHQQQHMRCYLGPNEHFPPAPHHHAGGVMPQGSRHVVKAAGPVAGYWVGNDWAPSPPPSEAYHHYQI